MSIQGTTTARFAAIQAGQQAQIVPVEAPTPIVCSFPDGLFILPFRRSLVADFETLLF